MHIKLWDNFSKRRNSTSIPASLGTTKDVYLKEETSIERPSFILQGPVHDWVYCYAFNKYYFITDVINLDGFRCEIVCDLDVLATFRDDIFNYTAFVERASYMYDEYINDPLLSIEQVPVRVDKTDTSLSTYFGSGCYVAEVLAMDKGISLYATPNLLPYQHILNPGVYSTQDVDDWVVSRISQSFDLDVYIGSVKWMPFNYSDIGTSMADFWIGPINMANLSGWSGFGYTTYEVYANATRGATVNLALPSAYHYNDFRDCNQNYTRYTLYLPGVGIVPLDSAMIGYCIRNGKTIGVNIMTDLISGEITYMLGIVDSASYIARFSGNISVTVPIGKSTVDVEKSAKMFAGSVATGAIAGGAWGAVGGAMVGAVEAIYNEMTPNTSIMVGGSGNKLELQTNRTVLRLSREQFGTKEFPTYVAGRPLMQNVLLGSLSGYVKCGNASVSLVGHEEDMAQVNNYLNSGFYIE